MMLSSMDYHIRQIHSLPKSIQSFKRTFAISIYEIPCLQFKSNKTVLETLNKILIITIALSESLLIFLRFYYNYFTILYSGFYQIYCLAHILTNLNRKDIIIPSFFTKILDSFPPKIMTPEKQIV